MKTAVHTLIIHKYFCDSDIFVILFLWLFCFLVIGDLGQRNLALWGGRYSPLLIRTEFLGRRGFLFRGGLLYTKL